MQQLQKVSPMDTVSERVRRTIASQLRLPVSDIKDEKRFVEDLKATSLDVVEMVMALEDEFEVEISDSDAQKMLTVGEADTYIRAKRG
jgi:acyl carrier protein